MELWWQTIKQFRFLSNTFPNKITVKDWTANQLYVLELAHHQKQEQLQITQDEFKFRYIHHNLTLDESFLF